MFPFAALSSAAPAWITPELFTPVCPDADAVAALGLTKTCSVPVCAIRMSSAAASPTVPFGALIAPWLDTLLPIRITSPPKALITPRFCTPASLEPAK